MWLVILLQVISPLQLQAEEGIYHVCDAKSGLNESFESYSEAYRFYVENTEAYDELVLKENDRVIMMEYGIVEFITDSACSLNHEYRSLSRNETDYINGCYGIDAAYIDTSADGEKVTFMISGDKGSIDIDHVILHPLSEVDTRISSYSVEGGKLFHNIKRQLDIDFYSDSLYLGKKVSGMKEGGIYYSADGHYFYDDPTVMIDDLRNETYENALNDFPYYNYYQYLPYRSYTNHTAEETESYFYETLGITGRLDHYSDKNLDDAADTISRSQLYGQIPQFFVCQDLYGTNALMLLASAVSESAYGRSYDSYVANSLFSLNAYETDEERQKQRYDSIEDSIYTHARYFISDRSANHLRSDYHGTYFGNKSSGLNINYSIDPYYGERSASAVLKLDEKLGSKDLNAYALGIIIGKDRVSFYEDQELENRMFSLRNVHELSLIVLQETEEAYQVRIDESFSEEGFYDPDRSSAYISRENVDLILNEEKIGDESFVYRHYDLDGGNYHGLYELDTVMKKEDLFLPAVGKDGYEFEGFDEEGKAIWHEIENIEIKGDLKEKLNEGQVTDLRGANLYVTYKDKENSLLPLNSDMISIGEADEDGIMKVLISYNGFSLERLFYSEYDASFAEVFEKAVKNKDVSFVRDSLSKADYQFDFDEIRQLDEKLKASNQRNYVITDKTERFDLSVSGLDLSLKSGISLPFVGDTWYVIADEISESDERRILDVAESYGFEKADGLDISFRFNYQNVDLRGPAIVQIDIDDKKSDLIYSVYHLAKNGDVIKCRTTHSNHYVQFMIEEAGPYLVLSMPSVNEYHIEDSVENLSYKNMGSDQHKTNLQVLGVLVLSLAGLIGITVYYIFDNKRRQLWKDFRKSLHEAGIVQEEKPKS